MISCQLKWRQKGYDLILVFLDLNNHRTIGNIRTRPQLTFDIISLSDKFLEVNIRCCINFLVITKNLNVLKLSTAGKVSYKLKLRLNWWLTRFAIILSCRPVLVCLLACTIIKLAVNEFMLCLFAWIKTNSNFTHM